MADNNKINEPVVGFLYNPLRDIAPVDQLGFVDLRDAYVNHSLPGDLAIKEDDYNGVEDPASLLGKSSDVFESIRKAQYVKSAESAAADKAAEVTSVGENA